MRYQNVCLESFGYVLPPNVVTSCDIEAQLRGLDGKLGLAPGWLERESGVRQRRFFNSGDLPSTHSAHSARLAIEAADIDADQIGVLVHASVWRDQLEPATACVVHRLLGLPPHCVAYDVSNACLGFLTGVAQVANTIELGETGAGLVVVTEGARGMVEGTIQQLKGRRSVSAAEFERLAPSLTLGSAGVAAILVHQGYSRTHNRILGGVWRTDSAGASDCTSPLDAAGLASCVMSTNSARLFRRATRLGRQTLTSFRNEIGDAEMDKIFTHQVSSTARTAMLSYTGMSPDRDFPTLEFLGNTASAALPISAALGAETGHLDAGDRVLFLGFGSGVNCGMLGVQWRKSVVNGNDPCRQKIESTRGGSCVKAIGR